MYRNSKNNKTPFPNLFETLVREYVKTIVLEQAAPPPAPEPDTGADPAGGADTSSVAPPEAGGADTGGGAGADASSMDAEAGDMGAESGMLSADDGMNTGSGGGFGGVGGIGGGGAGGDMGSDSDTGDAGAGDAGAGDGSEAEGKAEVNPQDPVGAVVDQAEKLAAETDNVPELVKALKYSIQLNFDDYREAWPIIKQLKDSENEVLNAVSRRLALFIAGV